MGLGGGLDIGLGERQRLGPGRAQADQFNAETGVQIVEFPAEQPRNMPGVAAGPGQFKTARQHFAIDLPHAQLKPPCAQRPALQHAGHVFGDIRHHPVEQSTVADRLHQAALHQGRIVRDHRQQRLGHFAQQLVEPDQRIGGRRTAGAETAGEGVASDALEIADAFESEAAEQQQHVAIEAQRRDGEIEQRLELSGIEDRAALLFGHPVMGERPGRRRRRSNREPGRQPPRRQPRARIGDEPRLAPEQMACAGDVDDHPIGRIERAPRPPALRPQRKLFEESQIACRIGRRGAKRRAQRPRIGEHRAGPRAGLQPRGIGGGDARAMRGFGDQRERLGVGPFSFSEPPAVDRQAGEPDREDAAGCLTRHGG